jgi:hypothetical protein
MRRKRFSRNSLMYCLLWVEAGLLVATMVEQLSH